MEVYCVLIEYSGVYREDDYTVQTLYASLEGAQRGLREKRDEILRKPGWNVDSIVEDEDNRFFAIGDEQYNESCRIIIYKEPVHE